jgi:glutathione peroxidase
MQQLHEKFESQGLVVLAVPSNDFGEQEPHEEHVIQQFYKSEFSVSFPVSQKQCVVGSEAHGFYRALTSEFGDVVSPNWNFAKYLVSNF